MKNPVSHISAALCALAIVLIAVGCGDDGKKKGGGSVVTDYYYQNGLCIDRRTGASVNTTLCVNSGTTGMIFVRRGSSCVDTSRGEAVVNIAYCNSSQFTLNGNVCYDNLAKYQVDPRYCQAASGGGVTGTGYRYDWTGTCRQVSTGQAVQPQFCGNGTQTGGSCQGMYYYLDYWGGMPQPVQCYGFNCRGLTLYNYGTGRQVRCN